MRTRSRSRRRLQAACLLVLAGSAAAQGGPAHVTLSRQVLEGSVLSARGLPVPDAVVVSSAGGTAVTDAAGNYRLELAWPVQVTSIRITAVAGTGLASAMVARAPGVGSAPLAPLRLARGGACAPSWLPTFEVFGGTDDDVLALAVFDDGRGSALYAGGRFTAAGNAPAQHVARWNGTSWEPLGAGVDDDVNALHVFDDGSGPALYVGGRFLQAGGQPARHVARWDGASWSALGDGRPNAVHALAVFDDGNGPALHAGAGFEDAGGVARWDGTRWQPLASRMNGPVQALAVFDDGGGTALFAAGLFTTAGGLTAHRIARWDGTSWSPLGLGLAGGVDPAVNSLAVFDDGTGPALHAGGRFERAGGKPALSLAKWDGSGWSRLATELPAVITVQALLPVDEGGGAVLYVGGTDGELGVLQRWDGASWTSAPVPETTSLVAEASVRALASFDDGTGPAVLVGGHFESAGEAGLRHLARWDGASWSPLSRGFTQPVLALTTFDDGTGPALYAGGSFTHAGGGTVNHVARWDGTSWTSLGTGMDDRVETLKVFDDGSGPALYAGGAFSTAGGILTRGVARWDGTSWSALGSGLGSIVRALEVFDDGGGSTLHAGGSFFSTGDGTVVRYVARWDGARWRTLATGLNAGVNALAVFDDGSGPALYAGGFFGAAGNTIVRRVARWNGASWTAVGDGIDDLSSEVRALAVHDDGSGPALYVGGQFPSASGVPAENVARWDGTGWSALASGVDGAVSVLAVHDAGCGAELYAGGLFSSAGGVAARNLARWNGTGWSPLGAGTSAAVQALHGFADGGVPALFAGGSFTTCFESGDGFLARWAVADETPPTLFCPTSVTVTDDLANGPGESVTFTVLATDERDPAPVVTCTPPSGSAFPVGTTVVTCTATDVAGNQASCEFPVTVQPKIRRR